MNKDSERYDMPDETTESRAGDGEHHATTGGAAAAGAVTGGVIGMAAGPAGAAVGAVGGAIVGAISERVMHSDDDREGEAMGLPNDGDSNVLMENRAKEGPRTYEANRPQYQSHWNERYGTTGRFEDHEPDYRYGHEMEQSPNYRGRSWTDVESDFRSGWESRYPDRSWDEHREHLRDYWDRPGTAAAGDTVQLREEELTAQKRNVETGRVSVEKDVVTEHRTMDVPVTREEAYVERRPVDRRPSDQPIGGGRDEIDVPLHEETVDVQKRPVVYEEVAVGKRTTQDTQRVEGDVRREVADIDREGDLRER